MRRRIFLRMGVSLNIRYTKMSYFNPAVSDAPANPRKLSVWRFRGKNAFCEHFSHNPRFLRVEQFVFSKLPRVNPDLDIFGGYHKCLGGIHPFRTIIVRYISIVKIYSKSNGIFSARNLSNVHFRTEYFRRFSISNVSISRSSYAGF